MTTTPVPDTGFSPIGAKGEHPPTIALRLAQLDVGDAVRVIEDGRAYDVRVTRGFRATDGGGFGSLDFAAITVGFGPGRWNTEVSAASISRGVKRLEIPDC